MCYLQFYKIKNQLHHKPMTRSSALLINLLSPFHTTLKNLCNRYRICLYFHQDSVATVWFGAICPHGRDAIRFLVRRSRGWPLPMTSVRVRHAVNIRTVKSSDVIKARLQSKAKAHSGAVMHLYQFHFGEKRYNLNIQILAFSSIEMSKTIINML